MHIDIHLIYIYTYLCVYIYIYVYTYVCMCGAWRALWLARLPAARVAGDFGEQARWVRLLSGTFCAAGE